MGLNGFGFGEVLLIAMLVLVVFGPKRLPEVTRTIGKGIREFKKGMNEIQRELEAAGRETKWDAPPTPAPKTPAAGTATIAGAAAFNPPGPTVDGADPAEGDPDVAVGTEELDPPSATEAEVADSAATREDPPAPAPVFEEQAPPVPREEPDPAEAYIDPWSTDSSRPTFVRPPPEEPVIAPPEEPVIAPPEEPVIAPPEEPVIAPPEAVPIAKPEPAPADGDEPAAD